MAPYTGRPTAGLGWIHEIKHDGFRILAHGHGRSVRLITRNGRDLDWDRRRKPR